MRSSATMVNIPDILNELTNHLMINGNLVFFSGLFYGKLGISLFFFHYAQYSGNSLYDEYARYLVDLVNLQIHDDYPLDYERGLAGVGAVFNYLKKHGYYHADDELMFQIDSKIAKTVNYERRFGLLTSFGRYFLSRYESNPNVKEPLIQLVDLLINHSDFAQTDDSDNTLSLMCDLYNRGIEKEMVERCLSESIDAFIMDVQEEPVSGKLFTLIKLSRIPSCIKHQSSVNEVLNTVFTHKQDQLENIHDLQWVIQCEKNLIDSKFQIFIPTIKRKIDTIIDSFQISQLDELFTNNQDFAFKGGYAGLGLALLSILDIESISWTTLL